MNEKPIPVTSDLIEHEHKALVDDWRGAQRQLAEAIAGGDQDRIAKCREIEERLHDELRAFRRKQGWREDQAVRVWLRQSPARGRVGS